MAQELPPWSSGELVAPLLHAIVSGDERNLPVNLPNTGQVVGLDHGPVLECMGVANASGITPRDRVQVESVLGECLRRIVYSQERTVEAALTGDRTLVLEAMLTDQMAGRLPFEHIVALTDELLTATAPGWTSSRTDAGGDRLGSPRRPRGTRSSCAPLDLTGLAIPLDPVK